MSVQCKILNIKVYNIHILGRYVYNIMYNLADLGLGNNTTVAEISF